MKKAIITIWLIIVALSLSAQVIKSLTNIAGTLSSALTANERNSITNLTMRGTLDARDFKTMRDSMPLLSVIDISTAKIIEYSGTKGTASSRYTSYNANTIPGNAFFNFSSQGKETLNEIKLPSGLTSIGNNAFRDCQMLGNFTLPTSLESIGLRAFKDCSNFTGELTIPESVISIGESAFEESAIQKVIINGQLTEIEKKTFMECQALENIILPQTLVSIGDSSFFNCIDLQYVLFPNSLRTIGIRAFKECGMPSQILDFNDGLLSIGEEAFCNCRFTDMNSIPASVSSIGKGAFRNLQIDYFSVVSENQFYSSMGGVLYNKDFSEIIKFNDSEMSTVFHIPSSVKVIAPYAFENCSYLNLIYIPETVDSIGEGAFYGITPKTIVIFDTIPIEVEGYDIFDVLGSTILHVPFGSKSLYQETEPWNNCYIEEGKILRISYVNILLADDLNSSAEVNVMCNNYWTAVSDESWLKVTPTTTLFGVSVIKVTADQNIGGERKANVIVMSPEKTDTIYITQEEFSGILFSDTIVNVGATDNLSDSINVISSGIWIASPDEAWLSLTPATPVNGNGTLNIQAQPNNGNERSATITVISEGTLSYITVIQNAGPNSFSDLQYANKLVVSPNPATDFIQLNDLKVKGSISIFNASGIKVKSINIESLNFIDISDLKSGIYFISFENKWGKFLKNKN